MPSEFATIFSGISLMPNVPELSAKAGTKKPVIIIKNITNANFKSKLMS